MVELLHSCLTEVSHNNIRPNLPSDLNFYFFIKFYFLGKCPSHQECVAECPTEFWIFEVDALPDLLKYELAADSQPSLDFGFDTFYKTVLNLGGDPV